MIIYFVMFIWIFFFTGATIHIPRELELSPVCRIQKYILQARNNTKQKYTIRLDLIGLQDGYREIYPNLQRVLSHPNKCIVLPISPTFVHLLCPHIYPAIQRRLSASLSTSVSTHFHCCTFLSTAACSKKMKPSQWGSIIIMLIYIQFPPPPLPGLGVSYPD